MGMKISKFNSHQEAIEAGHPIEMGNGEYADKTTLRVKMAPEIVESRYYDMSGKLLWAEPMKFGRLDGIGDPLIHDSIEYRVKRVAVTERVQVVNLMNARTGH